MGLELGNQHNLGTLQWIQNIDVLELTSNKFSSSVSNDP
jgi:hypothetical protein